MATELKPWSAAEGRLRQEGQVEKLAYFPKRLSASQRMNYFRYGTLQLSTVEFPMYLSFVKYSSVDTFFSQDKYEKFKSQKETFQGEGERLFGFHDNICFKQILVDLFSQFHTTVALEKIDISTLQIFFAVVHISIFTILYSSSSSGISCVQCRIWKAEVAWISIIS